MPYEPPTIETNLDVVTARVFDGIATKVPGWVPIEGTLDTAIAEEVGRETQLTNNRAVTVIDLGVVAMGETVFGLPARLALPASLEVDVTVTTIGDVIPAGFVVVGATDVGVDVAFELLATVTSDTLTEAVTMYAITPGLVGNGVQPGALVIATSTATVVSAVATGESEDGAEAETYQQYLDRLTDYLSLLRIGVVNATDLEVFARVSGPGVYRARAIDLYDALSESTTAERTATVFVVAANGSALSTAQKTTLVELIEDVREINFVAYVRDPQYTALTVEFEATADSGYDPTDVEAAVIAAITAYLDPATWGSTMADPRVWDVVDTVGYLDLVSVAGNVPGVASLVSLTLNGDTIDVTLPGPAPLPAATTDPDDPTTITGDVT